MSKNFYLLEKVGKEKYLVYFHEGVKTHQDGSPFYDIQFFSNKKLRNDFCKELKQQGFVER